jgi:hypothetical protein
MATHEMHEKLLNLGLDPANIPPGQLGGFLAREQQRYASIIKLANIKVE